MEEWAPAVLSDDGQYRYSLARRVSDAPGCVAFVGLNPSAADATRDDPTIRRCMRFTRDWGAGTLVMVNLFGLRSTDPRALLDADDPVGPDNDLWLLGAAARADVLVAAWGNGGNLFQRADLVRRQLSGKLWSLGLTKTGMPRHPLYVPASQRPQRLLSVGGFIGAYSPQVCEPVLACGRLPDSVSG